MQLLAFVITLLSVYASSIKRYRIGWVLTLAGCATWMWVAATSQLFWLGAQQVAIGALAISALVKLQPRKEIPSASPSN